MRCYGDSEGNGDVPNDMKACAEGVYGYFVHEVYGLERELNKKNRELEQLKRRISSCEDIII